MHGSRKKRLFIFLLSFAVLLGIWLFATALSIIRYGRLDAKTPCDTAIVLGAGTANREVSPVYRERINHAIWLYENGYVEYLILTGGVGTGNAESDAYTAKQYALSQQIPEEAILIEEVSTITEENLAEARQIMDSNGLQDAIIVSDPLHMKRAMLMAGDYGIDAVPSPTPSTMYRSWKTKLPFLLREEFFYVGYVIVRLFR